jgi:hypothetical protein
MRTNLNWKFLSKFCLQIILLKLQWCRVCLLVFTLFQTNVWFEHMLYYNEGLYRKKNLSAVDSWGDNGKLLPWSCPLFYYKQPDRLYCVTWYVVVSVKFRHKHLTMDSKCILSITVFYFLNANNVMWWLNICTPLLLLCML